VSIESPFGETCGPSLMELLRKGYEIFTIAYWHTANL